MLLAGGVEMEKLSNCNPTLFGVFDYLDNEVYVLSKDGKNPYLIDNFFHVFTKENESFVKFSENSKKIANISFCTTKSILVNFLYKYFINNKKTYAGIIFHDISNSKNFFIDTVVSRYDIQKNRTSILGVYYVLKSVVEGDFYQRTLINLFDNYFYYIDKINDKNNIFFNKENGRKYIKIYTSVGLVSAESYRRKNDGIIKCDTIRNILPYIDADNGIFIDDNKSYGLYIDRELLDEIYEKTNIPDEGEERNARLKYFTLLEKFYISTIGRMDKNNKTTFSIGEVETENGEKSCINVFEAESVADFYVDSVIQEHLDDIKPVGVIDNKETFKKILQKAFNLGAEVVTFDINTPEKKIFDIKEVFKVFFNKELKKNDFNEIVTIEYANNKNKYTTLTHQENAEIILTKSSFNDSFINNIIYNGIISDILCVSQKLQEKIGVLSKNEKDKKDTKTINQYVKYLDILSYTLIILLKEKRTLYIRTNKDGTEIEKINGFPIIETSEICSSDASVAFDLFDKTIEKLKKDGEFVYITDNCNANISISVDFIKKIWNNIKLKEENLAKMEMYLVLKCGFSVTEAEKSCNLILTHTNLYKEFISFINSSDKNTNIFSINGETVKHYMEKFKKHLTVN